MMTDDNFVMHLQVACFGILNEDTTDENLIIW